MNTYNIPDSKLFDLAKDQYKQLSEYFPDLFLAGGYLRDLVYDKTPRDMDFYFRLDTIKNLSYVFDEIFPNKLNLEFIPTKKSYNYSEYIAPFSFVNTQTDSLVQVIGMHRSMNQILAQFDFSFNQIYYDGYKSFVSDLFAHTLTTRKVLPVTKTSMKVPGMIERFQRFHKKFPELDFGEIAPLLPKAKPTKPKSMYTTTLNLGPLFAADVAVAVAHDPQV